MAWPLYLSLTHKRTHTYIHPHLCRELAATASLTQLDGKLDARAWDREWRVACERLDGKADAEEARALRGRLAGVEEVREWVGGWLSCLRCVG